MKNKEILNRVHDFLGKVVRDCPDHEMGLEASDLADDVWNVLHANEGLTFGQAIEAMKQGRKVARRGWNGKGMWLCVPLCDGPKEIPATGIWGKPNAEYAEQNGGKVTVVPYITMKAADGTIVMGWLASQTDMLSDDWVIVEENACASNSTVAAGSPPSPQKQNENPMKANNVKAMREALKAIISGYEKADFCDANYGEWCHNRNDPANACPNVALCKAIHEARAALAAPPRNCDVGTPEEQEVRFRNYCWNHSSKDKNMECQCPIDTEGKAGCKLA